MSAHFHDLASGVSRVRKPRTDYTGLLVAMAFVGLLLGGGIGAVIYMAGQKGPAKEKTPQVAEAEKPVAAVKMPARKADVAAPPSNQVARKEMTFDEAYKDAFGVLREMSQNEPATTEKDLRLLTVTERARVDQWMAYCSDHERLYVYASDLHAAGFSPWVMVKSARAALLNDQFKNFMRAVWRPHHGSSQIFLSASRWYAIRQSDVHGARSAVGDNNRTMYNPAIRNAIIALGGQDWLQGN